MNFIKNLSPEVKLLAICLLAAFIICAFLFIIGKFFKQNKFSTFVKRHPYWLIKVFVFSALFYPFVVEMLKVSKISKFEADGELLFSYKDYFITAIGLCLAVAAFIREDMNRKKEATTAVDGIANLTNDEEELKLNTCDKEKEKEQDQESK